MALSPITTKQASIIIEGCPGSWSSVDGGDVETDTATYYDTVTGLKQTVVGMLSITDRVLKRPYDPIADKGVLAWVSGQLTKPSAFTISIQPVNADLNGTAKTGGKQTYTNCVLTKYTPPKFDREGSGVAMIEITVAVNSMPTFS